MTIEVQEKKIAGGKPFLLAGDEPGGLVGHVDLFRGRLNTLGRLCTADCCVDRFGNLKQKLRPVECHVLEQAEHNVK